MCSQKGSSSLHLKHGGYAYLKAHTYAQVKLSELDFPDEFIQAVGGDFELYPHQEEAIKKLRENRNLIVAVPTAAGKTLIAYAAIYDMLKLGKKSLYIVPLKALAFEKYEELKSFRKLGYKVTIATGDYDASASFVRSFDVIVCTSEKADSMFRHDPSIVYDIGLIVADEAHLIGDQSRGPRLESVLTETKLLNPDTMILALSATISNSDEMCEWLDSGIVQSDFRPVPLRRGVIYSGEIIYEDAVTTKTAGDPIFATILSIINEGGQVLLFVNSRKRSEEIASKISLFLSDRIGKKEIEVNAEDDPYAERVNDILTGGVSFHHAGLSIGVRNEIESLFRNGKILTIVATPTLAAGVNLPARCVIVRDITRYQNGRSEYLPAREIFQMIGRAGRPRYDTNGFAYLYAASPTSYDRAMEYFSREVEPTISYSGQPMQVRFNSLSLVAMGIGSSSEDIIKFYDSSLYAYQNPVSTLAEEISQSIDFLKENDLIREKGGRLMITTFGKVTSDLYLDPVSAIILMEYLKGSHSEDVALFNICRCPDMIRLNASRDDYQMVSFFMDSLGIEGLDEDDFSAGKTAMVLKEWISETPMRNINEQYRIGPGDVQSISSSADWLSYSLARLAYHFKPEIRIELEKLNFRLKEGVREEIIPLTLIPNIGRVRARRLYSNGFKSIDLIAESNESSISKIYGFSNKLSREVITSAKAILARTARAGT